jgi:tetratricopeptide (TPR) repeat protein
MKKILFSVALMMVAGSSFAQLKNVKEAKSAANSEKPDFNKAEQLINAALTNDETKNDPATWDAAGYIQKRINEEQSKIAYLKNPYDTLKAYSSLLNMFEYYVKCDELSEVPDEKGKIKNKYRKANAATMLAERPNLMNGGIEFYNRNDYKQAVKYFGTYVESASYPMIKASSKVDIAESDTLLPLMAYYASLAANSCDDKAAILKYAPIAVKDKENGAVAMQLYSDALKSTGDSIAWLKSLQDGILQFPSNPYFFANLVDYYSSTNQPEKAMEFADEMLAKEPNNKLYLYVKAYLYHNMKDYDKAVEYYEKTVAADPEYAEAYSNLGLVMIMKAQDLSDAASTDINDANYSKDQAAIKEVYKKALPYYEKARSLRPDNKDLWAQGLYRVYYNLNMAKEFEEIEQILN